MLSREALEQYRRMTVAERLKLTMDSIELHMPGMFQGKPEVIRRRFQLLQHENSLRNQNILSAFARLNHKSCKH